MSDLVGNHIVGFPTRWLIYMANYRFAHHYDLAESIFIRSDFIFFFFKFANTTLNEQNNVLLPRHIVGYSVYLCPTNGTPILCGLNAGVCLFTYKD